MLWASEHTEDGAATLPDIAEWFTARIGKELGPSPWHTVTPEDVRRFADATHDWQWIHLDGEQARSGPYGRPVAHGFYTLSLVPHLTSTLLDLRWTSLGLNYRVDRVRFPAVLPVGARVRALAHVKSVRVRPRDFLEVVLAVSVTAEGQSAPVCTVDHTRLYRLAPGARLPVDGPVDFVPDPRPAS
ncbi:MaoC family dehydratase [Streptomyces prasinopilosus]|uniref:MaoC family dehydratase n=1 Tax=Streptomyces prasinopilosus TaxID=67344 RepID=UPI0006EBCC64|nr:MaoC family dehydratase [Streptomyces prasinopilosus]